MYQEIKSCISYTEGLTDFFACEVGVRQGENLSPFLFALYLNDLESYFLQQNVPCLEKLSDICLDEIQIYVRLFLLFYADDTILIAESPEGLQTALDAFESYCSLWKLKVNTSKTKIVIFSKRKVKDKTIK